MLLVLSVLSILWLFILFNILSDFSKFITENDVSEVYIVTIFLIIYPLFVIAFIIINFSLLYYNPAKDRLLNCHLNENKIIRIVQIFEKRNRHLTDSQYVSYFVFHFVDNKTEKVSPKETDNLLQIIKKTFNVNCEIQYDNSFFMKVMGLLLKVMHIFEWLSLLLLCGVLLYALLIWLLS